MAAHRRRMRRSDPLATTIGVRRVLEELRGRCPDLIPRSDKKLFSLLNALRHIERYPAHESKTGRPAQWPRETLWEVARNLRAILGRETSGKISIASFVGLYLRILRFPSDLTKALDDGTINLQEATLLARLSHQNLNVSPVVAQALRREVLATHVKAQGSQNSLRQRVQEVLGETDIISANTVAAAVARVDELLEVDPADKRHLFYEQIKDLFYAMREVQPEDIDEQALSEFTTAADRLSAVIYAIRQRRNSRMKFKGQFTT